ncbi:MBL fold metallo-hydrolase, partial [Escherichia coli]|nr:MBL fold metallo-hydrolase [Escherichia coli]
MRLLTSVTVIAVAAAMATSFGVAQAQTATSTASAATQQRTQVPGYYRMALGDDVVTALYDGYT